MSVFIVMYKKHFFLGQQKQDQDSEEFIEISEMWHKVIEMIVKYFDNWIMMVWRKDFVKNVWNLHQTCRYFFFIECCFCLILGILKSNIQISFQQNEKLNAWLKWNQNSFKLFIKCLYCISWDVEFFYIFFFWSQS